MGFFDRFRKKVDPTLGAEQVASSDTDAQNVAPIINSKTKTTGGDEPTLSPNKATGGDVLSSALLIRPHVTEKAAHLAELGTYVFEVPFEAEKIAIRKAVESLYKVKVSDVRTIRHAGKPVFRGRRHGARNRWKKALVTLAAGQKIDLYEGV